MVRSPSSLTKTTELKKGPWTSDEDVILTNHIKIHGHPNWRALPRLAGLARCGKSCRLRWTNYLQPGIKRGNFTREEEEIITTSHQLLGNKWSAIAAKLPGRTDNEIKNVWHTHLKKKLLNKDDIQQSSSSTNQSSISMMSNEEKDFILVDDSIFDTLWNNPSINQVQHTTNVDALDQSYKNLSVNNAQASNTKNNHTAYVLSNLPLQRSYSDKSYNNYNDVPSPEEFPETDESFWSEVLSSDHDLNHSGSSSVDSYYPSYDQQPVNESSFPPIPYDNVINMETDHPKEALESSFTNVGSHQVSNVSSEYSNIGGDVDDFWFDVLFRAGEQPVFLL